MSTIKEDIKEYLVNEGLRPQEEDFGFFFRYQMMNFMIRWDEEDELFLNISLPSIFEVDENNLLEVLAACNTVNVERKLIKSVMVQNSVWAVAELLFDSTPNYSEILPRTLSMLLGARDGFYEAMKG